MKELGELAMVQLDLSSLASVRKCAEHLLRTEDSIHLLINNAGVCFYPKGVTEDGFETHLGVNHFGHFLLTCLLLPRIIRSAPARIVVVSSLFHMLDADIPLHDVAWENKTYSSSVAYSQSKLANLLFAKELANKLQGTGVTTYAVHPGFVASEAARHADESMFRGARWLYNNVLKFFIKTTKQGAQTSIYCAVDENIAAETGQFYSNCQTATPFAAGRDPDRAKKLWDESIRILGLGDWNLFTTEDFTSESRTTLNTVENTRL